MHRYRIMDLSEFPDCCALSDNGSCKWLTLATCRGEECSIKRTKKEENDSLQHVYERLTALDISTQIEIAKKYYDGSMPWSDSVKNVKAFILQNRFKVSEDNTLG